MLPEAIRAEIAAELQRSIDNIVASCQQDIDHIRAECVREYQPRIDELEKLSEGLEAELRAMAARRDAETWLVAAVLGGVFVAQLAIDPGWGDGLTAVAAGGWLLWRLVLE